MAAEAATNYTTINGIEYSYYHVDITNDNHTNETLYGTMYDRFLIACPNSNCNVNHLKDHWLLTRYNYNVSGELTNCTDYPDLNNDGILDYDYDLDGTAVGSDYWEDLLVRQILCGQQQWNFGYNTDINDKPPEVLCRLHQLHHGFWG